MDKNTGRYFEKRFEFVGNENWYLPAEAFNCPSWQIPALQDMKTQLNKVKGQLSDFNLTEWSNHTKSRDPSVLILQDLKQNSNIELLTQAWLKFYECLCSFEVVPEQPHMVKSLHLCEAPGAFISALNYFLASYYVRPDWEWTGNSLNPYYEGNSQNQMIEDDRLIKHTFQNWNFGVDQTGDLTSYYNHEDIVLHCAECTLVTADGSVNCIDNPGEQENTVHFLHYCESMTALRVLQHSGSFVLKLFTMYEHHTVCLMYLLTCVFKKVTVFKPASSKSGNSEVYVVCLNFKGRNLIEHLWPTLLKPYRRQVTTAVAMFALSAINPEFVTQLVKCSNYFKEEQCLTINENVKFFKVPVVDDSKSRQEYLRQFKKRYAIVPFLPKSLRLFGRRRTTTKCSESDLPCYVAHNAQFKPYFLEHMPVIGRAIKKVVASRFVLSSESLSVVLDDSDDLLKDVTNDGFIIKYSELFQRLPQHLFQRQFVDRVQVGIETLHDLVVVGVPLLTNLLFEVMYVLGFGFKNVIVYKKGVIVFQNPIKEKIETVIEYFNYIKSVYVKLETDKYLYQFEPDIFKLFGMEYFYNTEFYRLICKYNDGLCKL